MCLGRCGRRVMRCMTCHFGEGEGCLSKVHFVKGWPRCRNSAIVLTAIPQKIFAGSDSCLTRTPKKEFLTSWC